MNEFVDRYKALLLMARLLRILDSMIKRRLAAATDAELFSHDRRLFYRAKELASPENSRAISLGRLMDVWFNHPFKRYIEAEIDQRLGPDWGLEGIGQMSEIDIKTYLINKSERHQSYSPKGRPLPVLPQGKVNAKKR